MGTWVLDVGNMDLEYGTTEDDRCKSKTMSMGIWEKHAFTNQNLMEHRQSMIDGPQLEVQNIEASKLYFIFVFVMFRRLRFGFPICSVCACVHVLSMFHPGIYIC